MEENHMPEEILEIEELPEQETEAIEESVTEQEPVSKPKKRSWLWPIVAGVIVLVMGLTVLFALLGSKVDYRDHVTLGQYKGLVVPMEEVTVTEDEVQKQIDTNLANALTYAAVDRAAQEDDTVNIDYVGRYAADGSEFAGGSATDVDLVLGSGKFIDGFEDGLIGASAGDVVELPLTFPEDYENTLMAGAQVIFTVTVNEVKEPVEAVLNEEFVQANSDATTVEEYRQLIYDQLLADKQASAAATREDNAWRMIFENTEIHSHPEQPLAKQLEAVRYDLSAYYGMEYEELVETYTGYVGITVEQFEEMVDQQAKYELEYKMITYIIADNEGITWTEEEYQSEVNTFLASSGALSVESFESYYKIDFEEVYRDRIIDSILHAKVTDFIMANAVTE